MIYFVNNIYIMLKYRDKILDQIHSKEYYYTESVKIIKIFVKIDKKVSKNDQIIQISDCDNKIILKCPEGGKILSISPLGVPT